MAGINLNANWYEITDKAQLICISNYQQISNGPSGNPLTVNYKLMTDIDFDGSGENWDIVGNADAEGWKPVGEDTVPGAGGLFEGIVYSGNFDGNWYTIKDLYINRPYSYQGFFWKVANSTEISNLGIVNLNIETNSLGLYVGGVSGMYGEITSSYATGSLNGKYHVGGLVGAYGTINTSYSNVVMYGSHRLGGLVGSYWTITDCYSAGNIYGTSNGVGGLVGHNDAYYPVRNSYVRGSIYSSGGATDAGAIIGYRNAPVYIYKTYAINNSSKDAIGYYASGWGSNSPTDYCSVGRAGCTVAHTATIRDAWSSAIWDNLDTTIPTLKNVGGIQ